MKLKARIVNIRDKATNRWHNAKLDLRKMAGSFQDCREKHMAGTLSQPEAPNIQRMWKYWCLPQLIVTWPNQQHFPDKLLAAGVSVMLSAGIIRL